MKIIVLPRGTFSTLAVCCQLLYAGQAEAQSEPTHRVGEPALIFEAQSFEGPPIVLEAYRGKVVMLDFWATWCGPCISELPNVVAAYEQYQKYGFEIIGISLDNSHEALSEFLAKHPEVKWPQVFDGKGWDNSVAELYDVHAIPHTVLIDPSGIIRAVHLRGGALQRAIKEILIDSKLFPEHEDNRNTILPKTEKPRQPVALYEEVDLPSDGVLGDATAAQGLLRRNAPRGVGNSFHLDWPNDLAIVDQSALPGLGAEAGEYATDFNGGSSRSYSQ